MRGLGSAPELRGRIRHCADGLSRHLVVVYQARTFRDRITYSSHRARGAAACAISRVAPDGDETGPAWAPAPMPRLDTRTLARTKERTLSPAFETGGPDSKLLM